MHRLCAWYALYYRLSCESNSRRTHLACKELFYTLVCESSGFSTILLYVLLFTTFTHIKILPLALYNASACTHWSHLPPCRAPGFLLSPFFLQRGIMDLGSSSP